MLCMLGSSLLSSARPVRAVSLPTGRPTVNQSKSGATPTPTDASPAAPAAAANGDFVRVRDQQGVLSVETPAAWQDVAESDWLLNGAPVGRRIAATVNQADYAANWGVPGITINYSTSLPAAMEPEDVLAAFNFSSTCQDGGRGALPAGQRTVIYQVWQNCAEAHSAAAVLVIAPTGSRDFYAVVEIYLAGGDDLRALPRILSSIEINPGGAAAGAAGANQPGAAPAPAPSTAGALTPTGTAALTATAPITAPITTQPAADATAGQAAGQAAEQPALATVVTDRLNVRGGPGTNYPRVGGVTRGQQLAVQGQSGNCAWLRVTTPDGTTGWISGDTTLATLNKPCATIPPATP